MHLMFDEDKTVYSFDSVVRYSETDKNERLSVCSLVNYFQDCSNFQSSHLNVGLDELTAAGRGWLLSYWQIDIRRFPKFGDKITTGTWAYAFERFMGKRNFIMLDENKDVLACADSMWVFVDTDSGKPVKAEGRFIDCYGIEPRFEGMEYEPRKIKGVLEWEEAGTFDVRRYHLDTNDHMNNAKYIQLAQEFLGAGEYPKMIRAEYRRSALYRETVHAFTGKTGDGRIQVDLRDDEGNTYAVIEFLV